MSTHFVIMAGGSGTRFWPYSTPEKPKQFLDLTGEGTMLQMTIKRLEGLAPLENIWILTGKRFKNLVKEQCPELPDLNIVGEPMPRDTSGAIALAAGLIAAKDSDATMVVLPADHVIQDKAGFQKTIQQTVQLAEQGNYVTIGIKPTYPAEIYGYLQCGDALTESGSFKLNSFIEKPFLEKAQNYLEDGSYYWNAGMFTWKVPLVLEELRKHLPEHAKMAEILGKQYGSDDWDDLAYKTFDPLPKISIDFGLMEKLDTIAMVKAEFDWNDVGGWLALTDLIKADSDNNTIQGLQVSQDIKNNIIITQRDKRPTLVVGVENCIIINADAGTLVCNREKIEKIKPHIEEIIQKSS